MTGGAVIKMANYTLGTKGGGELLPRDNMVSFSDYNNFGTFRLLHVIC